MSRLQLAGTPKTKQLMTDLFNLDDKRSNIKSCLRLKCLNWNSRETNLSQLITDLNIVILVVVDIDFKVVVVVIVDIIGHHP